MESAGRLTITNPRPQLEAERPRVSVTHSPTGWGRRASILLLRTTAPALSRSAQNASLWAKADTLRLIAGALPQWTARRLPIRRGQPLAHPFGTLSRSVQRNSKSADRSCCRSSSRTFSGGLDGASRCCLLRQAVLCSSSLQPSESASLRSHGGCQERVNLSAGCRAEAYDLSSIIDRESAC